MAIESALEFDFEADIKAATRFLVFSQRKAIPKAITRSLNKVGSTARTQAAREIRQFRRLKISEIKRGMRVFRARPRRPVFEVKVSRRPISLRRYGAKMGGGKRRRRVVVNVDGERQVLEHAFFIEGRPKSPVFERVGRSRLPIRKLFGPSLGTALEKQVVRNQLRRTVGERWPRVFRHELNFELDKISRV